jgi:hypothetical protein
VITQNTTGSSVGKFIVSTQFGQLQHLTVWRRTNLVCVPSLKAHLSGNR